MVGSPKCTPGTRGKDGHVNEPPSPPPTHPRGADVYTTTQTTTRQSTEPDVGLHMPLHLRETPQAQSELQQYSVAGTIEGGMAAYSRRPIPCVAANTTPRPEENMKRRAEPISSSTREDQRKTNERYKTNRRNNTVVILNSCTRIVPNRSPTRGNKKRNTNTEFIRLLSA